MKSASRLLCAGAALVLTGCWDFNTAYQHYCSAEGCNDGGTGGGSGGGTGGGVSTGGGGTGGGGSVGGGTGGGGGGTDAGVDAGCLNYGQSCSGVDQCCPTADGGFFSFYQGFPMGCSKLNLCELVPPGAADGGLCLPRGYACHDSTECCNGTCDNGRCTSCGSQGDPCSSVYGCCYDVLGVGCDLNTSRCVAIDRPDAGTACLSDDMCADDDTFSNYPAFCNYHGGNPGDLGTCEETKGTCISPGNPPSGGHGCCAGLATGTDGKCCQADGLFCNESGYSCCAGSKCAAGRCVPNSVPDPGLGDHCTQDFQSCGGNGTGYYCDLGSETCGRSYCFASMNAAHEAGCCKWSTLFDVCTFPDQATCKMFGTDCVMSTECCSNSCVKFSDGNYYCDQPAAY